MSTGPRLSWDINLGAILQAAVVLGTGATLYIVGQAGKTDMTAQQLAAFRTDIVARLADYQSDHKQRFDDLARQVSTLPDQTAAIRQLEIRVGRLEAAKADRDKQVGDLTATIMQDHADMSMIMSASRAKLGTR